MAREKSDLLTSFESLTIFEDIGKGGFGRVCRASHPQLRLVAYKEFSASCVDKGKSESLEDTNREISVHSRLQHENIVRLLGIVSEPRHKGIVMELAEYGDVLSFFDTFKDVQWPWKLKMAYDISLGMNYLHTQQRPIIHGDLKAKNVLVAKNFVTKISDFGLSVWKQFTFETTKLTGVKGGTVTHIPPENWKDINKKRTDKYDVYSFGILLWELLAFPKRPFDQADCHFIRTAVINNERPLLRDISGVKTEFLRQIVEKCWHQDPTIRPTFMELKGQLSEHVSGFQSDVDEARRKLKQKDFGSTNVPALSRCYQEYVQTNPDAGKQVCDNSTQLNLVSQPFSDQECKTRYALGGSGSGTLVSGNLDVEPYGQHSFDSKDGLQLSVVQETPEEDQEARTASSLSDTDGTGVQSSATVTTGTPVQPSTVVECFTVREFLSWLGSEDWAVQFYYDTKDHLVHIAVRSTDEETAKVRLKTQQLVKTLPQYVLGELRQYKFYPCAGSDSQASAASGSSTTLKPGTKIGPKCNSNCFMFSGTIVDHSTGVTVAHSLSPGDTVVVKENSTVETIGHCQETFDVVTDSEGPVTADIAVIELNESCGRVENSISLQDQQVKRLKIYKGNEPSDDNCNVVVVDQHGVARTGCIRASFFTDKSRFVDSTTVRLQRVLFISSDQECKEVRVTDSGDSGALVISQDKDSQYVEVRGIVLGYLKFDDKDASFTVANRLWDVVKAIADKPLSTINLKKTAVDDVDFTPVQHDQGLGNVSAEVTQPLDASHSAGAHAITDEISGDFQQLQLDHQQVPL